MKHTISLFATCLLSFSSMAENQAQYQSSVVRADAIEWGYLNPLRGDKSPGAADLWGDRTKDMATGMLVKFNKGFSSPPHIHNISYRGIVIDGQMHNDDPKALPMWLPEGSFWTQPAGENHITAANGTENMIYLEIDHGPYLVKPTEQQFDNGQVPINLHQSNMVWLKKPPVKAGQAIEQSFLWGSTDAGKLGGSLIRFTDGFNGQMMATGKEFRVVVISGQLTYKSKTLATPADLLPGSYFNSEGKYSHQITASENTLLYVRTDGAFHFKGN